MDFFKRLFGSGDGRNSGDSSGLYFYVRPKMCQEIVKVRIDMRNDLSQTDDGGYFVRKVVQATRCPFAAELHVNFDGNKRIAQIGVQDGASVEEAEYETWLAEKQG